jgi:hypothetical protein
MIPLISFSVFWLNPIHQGVSCNLLCTNITLIFTLICLAALGQPQKTEVLTLETFHFVFPTHDMATPA